jgi:hypothetical protein
MQSDSLVAHALSIPPKLRRSETRKQLRGMLLPVGDKNSAGDCPPRAKSPWQLMWEKINGHAFQGVVDPKKPHLFSSQGTFSLFFCH